MLDGQTDIFQQQIPHLCVARCMSKNYMKLVAQIQHAENYFC